ncbi:hypothetical protein [Bacteroides nordii]|uniref:hypothetical protein n=1 Tax=Bacteroides nordii TaxID=291645 RepID=UPI002A812D76|nr:hypothetical protein [Bacteroides nordii]
MRKQVKTDLFKPLFINVLQNIFPGSGEETAPRSRGRCSPEPGQPKVCRGLEKQSWQREAFTLM